MFGSIFRLVILAAGGLGVYVWAASKLAAAIMR